MTHSKNAFINMSHLIHIYHKEKVTYKLHITLLRTSPLSLLTMTELLTGLIVILTGPVATCFTIKSELAIIVGDGGIHTMF